MGRSLAQMQQLQRRGVRLDTRRVRVRKRGRTMLASLVCARALVPPQWQPAGARELRQLSPRVQRSLVEYLDGLRHARESAKRERRGGPRKGTHTAARAPPRPCPRGARPKPLRAIPPRVKRSLKQARREQEVRGGQKRARVVGPRRRTQDRRRGARSPARLVARRAADRSVCASCGGRTRAPSRGRRRRRSCSGAKGRGARTTSRCVASGRGGGAEGACAALRSARRAGGRESEEKGRASREQRGEGSLARASSPLASRCQSQPTWTQRMGRPRPFRRRTRERNSETCSAPPRRRRRRALASAHTPLLSDRSDEGAHAALYASPPPRHHAQVRHARAGRGRLGVRRVGLIGRRRRQRRGGAACVQFHSQAEPYNVYAHLYPPPHRRLAAGLAAAEPPPLIGIVWRSRSREQGACPLERALPMQASCS